jgi:hypothetical protein
MVMIQLRYSDFNGNIISSTGVLTNGGNATSTYQRTINNTYMYGRPTPYRENFAIFINSILINEVASTPTIDGVCNGNDWIELFNAGNTSEVDLTGFVLLDTRGTIKNESFVFLDGFGIYAGQFYVICSQPLDSPYKEPYELTFDIEISDTLTLLDYNGNQIATTGVLPNGGSATSTFQRTSNNTYMYGFPSPEAENFRTTRVPTKVSSKAPVKESTKLPTKSPTKIASKGPTKSPTKVPIRTIIP